MEVNVSIFENKLFSESMRWKYAMGNVASDLDLGIELDTVKKIYPKALIVEPFPRIGILNIMLPVSCNAKCPKICYIGKKRKKGVSFQNLISLVEQFAKVGGKLIRIVGDGEPTLYPHFVELCSRSRKLNLDIIVFTNGVKMISKSILQEYAMGRLYFYIKLWSENPIEQTTLVCPKKGWKYEYVDGQFGFAPKPFYQLYEVESRRVGFQVMVCILNEKSAREIVTGRKKDLPILSEYITLAGNAEHHPELVCSIKDFPTVKFCSKPPRGSYMATLNSIGELQPGIFVPEGAVSVIGKSLKETWKYLCLKNKLFFQARYTSGCFCEAIRMSGKKYFV